MTDLRAIACILDVGRQYADQLEDAALSAALGAMCEAVVGYYLSTAPDSHGFNRMARPDDLFNVGRDFAEIADRIGARR